MSVSSLDSNNGVENLGDFCVVVYLVTSVSGAYSYSHRPLMQRYEPYNEKSTAFYDDLYVGALKKGGRSV